jgi:chemotaxis protein MotB
MADKKDDEPKHKLAAAAPRRKPRFKLALLAIVAMGAAGGLGYLSFQLWNQNKDLDTRLAKQTGTAETCTANLTNSEDRLDKANRDFGECKTKSEAEATRYASIDENLKRMEGNLKASGDELEKLRKQRAVAEERLAAFRELTSKLRAMIDAGQLQVAVRKGRMVVELPAEVMFASGSAELAEAGKIPLSQVAGELARLGDRQFMIAGHTDNRPLKSAKYRNNWELSTARAVTVTEFMVLAGLKAKNLVAAGYGENDPLVANNSSRNRQKNRRIEIVLLPNVDELAEIPDDLVAEPAKPEPAAKPAE